MTMQTSEMATSVQHLLTEIMDKARGCSGIGVALVKDGTTYTYQFGLEAEDFEVIAKLFEEFGEVVPVEN